MIVLKVLFAMMMLGLLGVIGAGLVWEPVLGRTANERFVNISYAVFIVGVSGLLLAIVGMVLFR